MFRAQCVSTHPSFPQTAHSIVHCNTLQQTAATQCCNTLHHSCIHRARHVFAQSSFSWAAVGQLRVLSQASFCSLAGLFRVCFSVVQYVAVCCSVLQCIAVCCSALQCVEDQYVALRYAAVYCSVLLVLQCVAAVFALWLVSFVCDAV